MKQIPFLQEIEPELEWSLYHKIYYSMRRRTILKDDLLCKPGSEMKNLTIIQDGVIDVFVRISISNFNRPFLISVMENSFWKI